MVFKGEVVVICESKVFEMVYCLYRFVVSDDGVVGFWGAMSFVLLTLSFFRTTE